MVYTVQLRLRAGPYLVVQEFINSLLSYFFSLEICMPMESTDGPRATPSY